MNNPIIVILMVLLGMVLGYFINYWFTNKNKKPVITSDMIAQKLVDCSDLTTCNLVYVDLVKYEQGTIPIVTKKSFSMIYTANIRAGIDLSLADVSVHGDTVKIVLPEVQVQSIEVDTDSLRFYDERFALFNWSNKEDIAAAITAARNDAEAHANLKKLKDQAREQAQKVVGKLVEAAVGEDKEVIVE